MKALFGKHMIKAVLGGALAAGIIATGTASADRGDTITSAPQEPPEEYVLTYLNTDPDMVRFSRSMAMFEAAPSGDPMFRFEVAPDNGSSVMQGVNSLQVAGGTSNGVGGGPSDLKAGPGCSIQCITSGVAYARGPNAKLVVKTDTLARIWIHVSGPNGYYRVQDSGADEVMQFGALFDDLQAGTTYQAWAVAKDKQNYESEAHGGFTTLERNVEIVFSQANLIDHAYNDSDYKMDVWLDGQWDESLTSYNNEAIDYTVPLGIHFEQLNDVDRYLDFAIQLYEAQDNCNNLGNIDVPTFGEASCSFLSYAALLDGENDLDARPADADSWTEWTLTRTMERPSALWPTYDSPLLFEVPVTLNVTYTPVF